jgi:hypothetical protein
MAGAMNRRTFDRAAKRRTRPAGKRAAARGAPAAGTLPWGLAGVLDDVKATTLALLASLQEKERVLRRRGGRSPLPGVRRGLSDIEALRRWSDKTLRTIEVLERGRSGELHELLEELGEFGEILRERQPAIPPVPPQAARR